MKRRPNGGVAGYSRANPSAMTLARSSDSFLHSAVNAYPSSSYFLYRPGIPARSISNGDLATFRHSHRATPETPSHSTRAQPVPLHEGQTSCFTERILLDMEELRVKSIPY